jgi:hypothetical protein
MIIKTQLRDFREIIKPPVVAGMSQSAPSNNLPIWLPPIQIDWIISFILIVLGANIERVPEEYHTSLTNPIVFVVGILFAAGLASEKHMPIAFSIAFCLVNIVRLVPRTPSVQNSVPGKVENFEPSGTLDWVTTNKKWFVEKVLNETPIAIVEKEISTCAIDG